MKYLRGIVLMGLIVLVGGIVWFQQQQVKGAAAGWLNAYLSTTNIGTSVTVGLTQTSITGGYTYVPGIASSTQVLASNTARVYARVQNISKNGYTASCLLGSTATSSLQIGIVLAPLASSTLPSAFELNADNPYAGAIYCFSQSTTTLSITEN